MNKHPQGDYFEANELMWECFWKHWIEGFIKLGKLNLMEIPRHNPLTRKEMTIRSSKSDTDSVGGKKAARFQPHSFPGGPFFSHNPAQHKTSPSELQFRQVGESRSSGHRRVEPEREAAFIRNSAGQIPPEQPGHFFYDVDEVVRR